MNDSEKVGLYTMEREESLRALSFGASRGEMPGSPESGLAFSERMDTQRGCGDRTPAVRIYGEKGRDAVGFGLETPDESGPSTVFY
jgi:hypothetical protein